MTTYEKRIPIDVFYVECDICGAEHAWDLDEVEAVDCARACDWHIQEEAPWVGVIDYCPSCIEAVQAIHDAYAAQGEVTNEAIEAIQKAE